MRKGLLALVVVVLAGLGVVAAAAARGSDTTVSGAGSTLDRKSVV